MNPAMSKAAADLVAKLVAKLVANLCAKRVLEFIEVVVFTESPLSYFL
jgi:hypothetical protein